MSRLIVFFSLMCVVALACQPAAQEAGATATPGVRRSTVAIETDTPTIGATARPSLTLSPTIMPTALELSDRFWKPISFGGESPEWATVEEVVAASDLVVLGTVVDIRLGRRTQEPGSLQFVLSTVAIDDVLKGVPISRAEGTIDVEWALSTGESLADVRAHVPDHRVILYLYNQGLIAERAGHPEDIEFYQYQYIAVSPQQGTLRDIDGRAHAIVAPDSPNEFPGQFQGGPFDELLQATRSAGRRTQ